VVCLGRATKVVQFLSGSNKTYEATVAFGQTSPTYDREGLAQEELANDSVEGLTRDELERHVSRLTGRITQTVPAFSAVRLDGRRLHEMARKGEEVTLPSREVEILSASISEFKNPTLRVTLSCSPGTYVRSWAHDLGQLAGCGAYLHDLNRTASGVFSIDDALGGLEELERLCQEGSIEEALLPVESALDFGAIVVTDDFAEAVINGLDLRASHIASLQGRFGAGEYVVLKDRHGRALAVGRAGASADELLDESDRTLFEYKRVLN
jgi:tRNA pseudouridine55 synthase